MKIQSDKDFRCWLLLGIVDSKKVLLANSPHGTRRHDFWIIERYNRPYMPLNKPANKDLVEK